MRCHGSRKYRRECKHRHQNQRQEYAKQRCGGSQEGCPIKALGLRILNFQSGEKMIGKKMNFAHQDVNAKGIDVCSEEEQKIMCMREPRIMLFMQGHFEACRDECKRC